MLSNTIHKIRDHKASQKNFSDIELKKDPEFDKVYAKLQSVHEKVRKIENFLCILMPRTMNNIFPTAGLIPLSLIEEYRKDYITTSKKDYSGVLFIYKNLNIKPSNAEVIFGYDFDKNYWYTLDNTYNPSKEYRVVDGKIFEAISNVFNPEKDGLLKYRLDYLKKINR